MMAFRRSKAYDEMMRCCGLSPLTASGARVKCHFKRCWAIRPMTADDHLIGQSYVDMGSHFMRMMAWRRRRAGESAWRYIGL